MIYSVRLKTATTIDNSLIPLVEAKNFLRVTLADSLEDSKISQQVTFAREMIETYLNRVVLTSTWTHRIDQFPISQIQLIKGPVASVSSVKYYTNATPTVLTTLVESTDYRVDIYTGRIGLVTGKTWPSTKPDTYDAVQVEYVAGYTVATCPPGIKQAILYQLWENYHGDPMHSLIEAACGFYKNIIL